MMTPLSSVALGATYSSSASSSTFCRAPIVSLTGMPSWSLPTSVSSILPWNCILVMSATVATVVPSLKVLAWMTELPTLMGTSRTMPSMVERICVLLNSLYRWVMPFFTISMFSRALRSSSWALARAVRLCSNSSSETTPLSWSAAVRLCSRRVCERVISAVETRDSALDSCPISGTTLTVAMTSPWRMLCPASL